MPPSSRFGLPISNTAAALNVALLADRLDAKAASQVKALETDIDDFRVHGREIYWLCRKKQSRSTFSNVVLERALGRKATFRGVQTIRRMAAKYCDSAPH